MAADSGNKRTLSGHDVRIGFDLTVATGRDMMRKMPRLKAKKYTDEEKAAIILSPTKECPLCLNVLPKEAFDINSARFDGRSNLCNPCVRQRWRQRYVQNAKQYYQDNRQKLIDYSVKYLKDNPDVGRRQARKKENVIYKYEAKKLRKSLDSTEKRASEALKPSIGCSNKQLAAHLEKLWKPGMTWSNHSYHGWHIDHIKPAKAFDLTNPEQRNQYRHYTNLQPLWRDENLAKAGNF